jgi:competence protein ComEC
MLIAFGGLWLCLWQQPGWRAFGLIGIVLGGVVAVSATPPDILISDNGRAAAVRKPGGELIFLAGGKGFVADSWRRRSGQALGLPDPSSPPEPGLRCDPLGCVYRGARKVSIAYARDIGALIDDCGKVAVVISRVPVRRGRCKGPSLVIGWFDLWRNGAHAIWLEPDGPRVASAGQEGGRPWSRYPRRRSKTR